jgi:dihydrofolate reductase
MGPGTHVPGVSAARHGVRPLVDEIRVYVHPALVGRGTRLFPEGDIAASLRLLESHVFGNGVVMLRYERDSRDGGS